MSDEKDHVRQLAKQHRDRLIVQPEWADDAATVFLEHVKIPDGAVVASYYAMRNEIDPSPIVLALWKKGVELALPVVQDSERALRFARWRPDMTMTPAMFGLMEPAQKEWLEPDILIVPLLAFDQRGYRIGYGKGHYDETIQQLKAKKPILTVGLAYAEQAVLLALPTEPHDQKLDMVVTPQRLFDFRK